ncbi:MAG TPA: electron transfer flavoprotein subunit beta/FixA family protein, partial [Phycisphaerae bacterium]|nr:electron transfer flavoprotein subunit beta/FixA family protein [Phycisphaerae bacterium]
MAYNIVVLIKQVPDTKRITGEAMRDDGTVNRSALPAIFNPEDLHALETALELRERHGGRVTVVTMGPPMACETLRESLERGADDVVLLTDRRAAASDTLATSYILSCAVRKLAARKPVDMVVCGRQAIDGDTAQVPPQTAEKLGWPQVTYVEEVEAVEGRTIRARRNTGTGTERVECPLPCLLTVTDQAPAPR